MKLLRTFRIVVSLVPATVMVAVMRALRPFILIRVGTVKTDRIGHFSIETELRILESREFALKSRRPLFDIFFFPPPISNFFLAKKWREVIRVWPSWLMISVFRLNERIPGGDAHVIPHSSTGAFDLRSRLDGSPTTLRLTQNEENLGKDLLQKIGLGEDRQFICAIARDKRYYEQQFGNRDLSYHSFRNCDIDTYIPSFKFLESKGICVVRMGAAVEKPLGYTSASVIDYASGELRNEFGDVFLASKCRYCMSDGLGFFGLAAIFRRPSLYVNFSPLHMFYTSRSCDLGIPKLLIDKHSGRIIPLRELREVNIARLTRSELLEAEGLELLDNSDQDVLDVVQEMEARLDLEWEDEPEMIEAQESFWAQFLDCIGEEGRKIHGEVRARLGSAFLMKNQEWWS